MLFLKSMSEKTLSIKTVTVHFMNDKDINNKQLIWLLKKIRNRIAHQNIMSTSDSINWKEI